MSPPTKIHSFFGTSDVSAKTILHSEVRDETILFTTRDDDNYTRARSVSELILR
jgi:hypothetical protein